jgi:adenylate cyclase class IV
MAGNKIDFSQVTVDPSLEYEYETRLKVDKISFAVIESRVQKMYGSNKSQSTQYTDYYVEDNNYRYTTDDNLTFTKMLKNELRAEYGEDLKYSLSTEHILDVSSFVVSEDRQMLLGLDAQAMKITNVRRKNRTPYIVGDISIHLTEVRNVNNVITSYEVEVETNPFAKSFKEDKFDEIVKNVYDNKKSELDSTLRRINISPLTDFGKLHRPIDLTIENILKGDIVNTVVSRKPDGEYRFIVVNDNYAWLVYPGTKSLYLGTSELFDTKSCVISGEIILDGETDVFVPFDLLYLRGRNIMEQDYQKRVVQLKKIVKDNTMIKFSNYSLRILHKTFARCGSVEQFFDQVKVIMSKATTYDTDGLIFTPNTKYGSYDIYKWKPIDELTVDAKLENGRYYLSMFNKTNKKRENIPYDGPVAKLKPKMIFRNIMNLPDGIIEFKPLMSNGEVVMEDNKVVLVSKRSRQDKMYPNTVGIASKLYNLIVNPISEKTITGENTVLMRKYHNTLKRRIFSNTDNNSYLIDIGSGKGGDISKWGNFQRVLAVEPDGSYIEEFKRRVRNSSMKNKINMIRATSEETEKIVNALNTWDVKDSTVYISFMFSYGFLWDPDRFNGMVNTITAINTKLKTKCKILFITVDGNRLKALFDNEGSDTITLNTISMSRVSENSMTISINDSNTVTRTQTEFFVYPRELFSKLGYSYIPKYSVRPRMIQNQILSSVYLYRQRKQSWMLVVKLGCEEKMP